MRFGPWLPLLLLLPLTACAIEPALESGDVLFQDDFSRTMSGWDQHQSELYEASYHNDHYSIRVIPPDTDVWSTPNLHFDDVRLQVEASKSAGPDNNLFGLVCRYQDPRNFYFFAISSDGYAGIGLNKDGGRRLLTGDALVPAEAVRQGTGANVLRADCVGYQLRLYVNGVLVAEAQAAEWQSGDVGLLAGSYDQGGVVINFDNFSVVEP